MGLWSSIKRVAKKVWRAAKAVVRVVWRAVATLVLLAVNVFDLLLGFLNWPPKKLTLHVIILSKYDPNKKAYVPLASKAAVQPSIDTVKKVLKDTLNVDLRPYASEYIQVFKGEVPDQALNPSCCDLDHLGQEFTSAGEFYAQNTAGWVGIPISPRFPITVFVVEDVQCHRGCSNGPLSDYVVCSLDGLNSTGPLLSNGLFMHEIGHCCNLIPHRDVRGNLMYKDADKRGPGLIGLQRNFFRASRHVTYW